MTKTLSISIIAILLTSFGIDTQSGGFHTSDKEYMETLYAELDKNNFTYSVDSDGFIRYQGSEKAKFNKTMRHVDHILNEGHSVTPETNNDSEYLITLLKQNNLEHYAFTKDGRISVRWYPSSEKHFQETMLKVVENSFSKIKNKQKPVSDHN